MIQPANLRVEISNRQILKIALPISFAILLPHINFLINNIFLGHYSEDALAVAGITGVYYLIFAAMGYGLNNGMQILIARRAGENRPNEIGKIFNQGIFISVSLALFGILTTWFLTPLIYRLIFHDQNLLNAANEFLRIRIWGLPFLYVYQMRNALLIGTNQSKYLIVGTLAEAGANILFDYLLIFGKFGFPEMGFNGAALASVIAEFIGMFVIYLFIRQKGISKRFSLFCNFAFDKQLAFQILSLASPLMFQHAISIISWQYFFLLIEHHGQLALQVSNVMRNVFGIFGASVWAFASTTNAMVSNVIGQGRKDQVWSLIIKICKLSIGYMLVVVTLLNLFPQAFLSVFGQNEIFVADAIPIVRIVSAAMLLMSFSAVFLNAVTGTGNSRVTFLIEVSAIVFYCAYIYLILEYYFLPITFGWMSEWLYWICLFIPSIFYILSGRWKGKKI